MKHHGIEVLSIHGKHSQRQRIATLERFRSSGRDGPRVLLISNVGSVGLNIAFANILVIVVRQYALMLATAMLIICANSLYASYLA